MFEVLIQHLYPRRKQELVLLVAVSAAQRTLARRGGHIQLRQRAETARSVAAGLGGSKKLAVVGVSERRRHPSATQATSRRRRRTPPTGCQVNGRRAAQTR